MMFKVTYSAGLHGTQDSHITECDTEEEAWEEAEEACLEQLERYGITCSWDEVNETYLNANGYELELDYSVEELT